MLRRLHVRGLAYNEAARGAFFGVPTLLVETAPERKLARHFDQWPHRIFSARHRTAAQTLSNICTMDSKESIP